MIKVAVVDDHELFREGVISMLSRNDAIKIVGEGGSAADAIRIAQEAQPDVMLLDVAMPGGGIEVIPAIVKSCPNVRLIMLTVSEAAADVMSAFQSGVAGYMLKGIRRTELIGAVQAAHQGETVLAPSLAGRILSRLKSDPEAPQQRDPGLSELTPREVEVLTLVAQGLSNKSVAHELGLSERTIKNNMTTIMQKLQVSNRVAATLKLQSGR